MLDEGLKRTCEGDGLQLEVDMRHVVGVADHLLHAAATAAMWLGVQGFTFGGLGGLTGMAAAAARGAAAVTVAGPVGAATTVAVSHFRGDPSKARSIVHGVHLFAMLCVSVPKPEEREAALS
jgi:hypothetical protein